MSVFVNDSARGLVNVYPTASKNRAAEAGMVFMAQMVVKLPHY